MNHVVTTEEAFAWLLLVFGTLLITGVGAAICRAARCGDDAWGQAIEDYKRQGGMGYDE